MKFIWVVSGRKIKQLIVVLTALIFTIGIIYTEKENIPVFFSLDGPKAVHNVKTIKKQVALTFDISWGETRPEPILDILDKYELKNKVTFFISSPWSEEHPEIVRRMVESGYEIGSHGYKHVNYSKLTDEEIENQILKADSTLKNLAGKDINLLRTPNGDYDSRVLNIANKLNYTVILWDTDSRDWMNPGVNEIVNRVLDNVHQGDIILMHASDSSKQTHEALPIIIQKLKQEGYEFVTVSQLITGAQAESKELD